MTKFYITNLDFATKDVRGITAKKKGHININIRKKHQNDEFPSNFDIH